MKKVLGLILELNPFHNGHMYFINQAIDKVKPDITIAVISGNYTMRGEVSVIDKFTKTELLLDSRIDLVLELPFISAINSADLFSENAVNILSKFKTTDIAFGVELNDITKLNKMKDIIDSDIFNTLIKEKLDLGLSYNSSSFKTLSELTNDFDIIDNFTLPNNTLAIQYLRSIDKLKKKVDIHLIKRIKNEYYDKTATSEIASATSLRLLLEKGESIDHYVPNFNKSIDYINPKIIEDNLFILIKYVFSVNDLDYIKTIYGVSEGIENRIYSFLQKSNSYDELINNIKTKRYTTNKIKRLLLHIIMDINNKYMDKSNYYLRVLGASNNGLEYLNTLPKTTKSKIITSLKNLDSNEFVQIELKATKIYEILTNKKIYIKEFKIPIIGGRNDN